VYANFTTGASQLTAGEERYQMIPLKVNTEITRKITCFLTAFGDNARKRSMRGVTTAPEQQNKKEDHTMTKTQTIAALAEQTDLSKSDVSNVLDRLADLAYAEAANGFTLPGIGKLMLVQRAERQGRNPATGESITIPAKTVVKFRVAKACKDALLK